MKQQKRKKEYVREKDRKYFEGKRRKERKCY
jgi:hypothetical protein